MKLAAISWTAPGLPEAPTPEKVGPLRQGLLDHSLLHSVIALDYLWDFST
jgi:hypothetical protein